MVETGYGRSRLWGWKWKRSSQILGGGVPNENIQGMGYGIIGTGYGRNGLR